MNRPSSGESQWRSLNGPPRSAPSPYRICGVADTAWRYAVMKMCYTCSISRIQVKERRGGNGVNLQSNLGGTFTLHGGDLSLHRLGYGAMQLAGPGVWGPPRDVDAALAVLREAVALGINHIDTSDYYGPHITNQLI